MKKILPYVLLATAAFAVSCEYHPYADFSSSHSTAYIGERIVFTNFSSDADYFEWDFGDGYVSKTFDAAHSYETEGIYTVTLTAYSDDRQADRAMMDIHVVFPTTLEVEVLEYYDEYPVRDAEVVLYPTLADWEDMTRPVASGLTDRDGFAVFTELEAKSYFVDVFEHNHNNYILAEEDINFIHTLPLEPHMVNHFFAYVDYVAEAAPSKGTAKKQSKQQLKIMKLERKYSDKVPLPK
jgi:hypothetical protein